MDHFIFGIFKYSSKRFQIKYQGDTHIDKWLHKIPELPK